ncbi:hypothetical protein FHG87_019533 [Trinorchestia longiramus]|nr:hypothetical protein FHG87_019533 [Trinorchestia longiramus]
MTFGNVLLASGGMKTLPEHDLFYNMFEYLEDWHRLHTSSTCPSRPLRERLLLHTTTRHEQQFRRVLEDLQSSAALRVVDSNSDIVNAACNAAMMSDISVMYLEDLTCYSKPVVGKVVDIDPWGSRTELKGSINLWGSEGCRLRIYMVEAGFSHANAILTKQRNRLNLENRSDLRLKLTNFKPNINSLAAAHQAHPSH